MSRVTKTRAGELGMLGFMNDVTSESPTLPRNARDPVRRPAAHKVYHFQPVARCKRRLTPPAARHDLPVALDCNPVGGKLQPLEQSRDGQGVRHFPSLTVQMDRDQS